MLLIPNFWPEVFTVEHLEPVWKLWFERVYFVKVQNQTKPNVLLAEET